MKTAQRNRCVAAFFDVDGTLVGEPSLERRLFAQLRRRKAIPVRNYFLWAAEALRLAPRGIAMVQHGNKMYLRRVRAEQAEIEGDGATEIVLYREGMERMAWHAKQGHFIVLMTGTLAPLAMGVARLAREELRSRGSAAHIRVCATHVEEIEGRWTGRIVGEALYGEAKARAVRGLAQREGLDLGSSYAYGDSAGDRWLLESVGRAAAVNPSDDLERIAQREGWPVLWWTKQSVESPQSSQGSQRRAEAMEIRSLG